jgi:hypothetical protein
MSVGEICFEMGYENSLASTITALPKNIFSVPLNLKKEMEAPWHKLSREFFGLLDALERAA